MYSILQKYSFGFILPQGTKFYNLPPQGASTLDYFNELFGNSVQSPFNVISPDTSENTQSQSTAAAQTAQKPPQIKGTPTPPPVPPPPPTVAPLQPGSQPTAATLTAQKGKLKTQFVKFRYFSVVSGKPIADTSCRRNLSESV